MIVNASVLPYNMTSNKVVILMQIIMYKRLILSNKRLNNDEEAFIALKSAKITPTPLLLTPFQVRLILNMAG